MTRKGGIPADCVRVKQSPVHGVVYMEPRLPPLLLPSAQEGTRSTARPQQSCDRFTYALQHGVLQLLTYCNGTTES